MLHRLGETPVSVVAHAFLLWKMPCCRHPCLHAHKMEKRLGQGFKGKAASPREITERKGEIESNRIP